MKKISEVKHKNSVEEIYKIHNCTIHRYLYPEDSNKQDFDILVENFDAYDIDFNYLTQRFKIRFYGDSGLSAAELDERIKQLTEARDLVLTLEKEFLQ